MFTAIFALFYIPFILLRVVFMLFRMVGRVLAILARTAIHNQQAKANRQAKRKMRTVSYPTINGRRIFV
jgi:hypothetical protein